MSEALNNWRKAIDELAQPPAPTALAEMEARKDAAYLERNQVVAALAKAYPSGVARTAIEGWSEDWHGCVYIDLPTGQASWHFHDSQAYLFAGLPAYAGKWDGHDTPEKYRRLAALQPVQQPGAEPEPIMVEAVAEVRSGAEGLYLDWLIEGGICALVEGCVLVMPTQPITDDDGSGEVYLSAPAQRQPLSEDADGVALRRAVANDLTVRLYSGTATAQGVRPGGPSAYETEADHSNPCAAARRAIHRAADIVEGRGITAALAAQKGEKL